MWKVKVLFQLKNTQICEEVAGILVADMDSLYDYAKTQRRKLQTKYKLQHQLTSWSQGILEKLIIGQEIIRLLWNLMVHYRIHNSKPLSLS
jgi:hypothetical protein